MLRFLAIFVSAAALVCAQQKPWTELLWPQGAPGALGTAPEDKPSLTF